MITIILLDFLRLETLPLGHSTRLLQHSLDVSPTPGILTTTLPPRSL